MSLHDELRRAEPSLSPPADPVEPVMICEIGEDCKWGSCDHREPHESTYQCLAQCERVPGMVCHEVKPYSGFGDVDE